MSSGIVVLWGGVLEEFHIERNVDVLERVRLLGLKASALGLPSILAVEMIASYGMPVGREVFETCVWIGRFVQHWTNHTNGGPYRLVYRSEVKIHVCGTQRAKDGNVRQALIDMFPPAGGGKVPQIGTKPEPGPLYGVTSHAWQALGVAVTAEDGLIAPR
jgi:hypothetical protein